MSIQFTFTRELRLLTPSDFNTVFKNPLRASSPHITFVAQRNDLGYPRIGFALAKKQIKRAHERNRLKRIIRDYFRLNQHQLPAMDMVVMARTSAMSLTSTEIRELLDKLWQRLLFLEQRNK